MVVEILVMVALFAAAAFQSASGLGFGLVAGPVLIAALGPGAGLQVAVLLNLLVAAAAWGLNRGSVRYDLLVPMLPGIALGLALGSGVSVLLPGWAVKSAMCVALSWVWLAREPAAADTRGQTFRLSAIAGVMGGALAIPGPAAAVYLRGHAPDAKAFRSSMMPLLTGIYLLSGLGMYAANGLDAQALNVLPASGPAVIGGMLFGALMSRSAPERLLQLLVRAVILITFAVLLCTTLFDCWALLDRLY